MPKSIEAISKPAISSIDSKEVFLVVQQGGTSRELYFNTYDQLSDAEDFRASAAESSYNTTPPIKVPAGIEAYLAHIETITDAVLELD